MILKFINVRNQKIAEYDSVMGLYYVKGEEYNPFTRSELETSPAWEILEEN